MWVYSRRDLPENKVKLSLQWLQETVQNRYLKKKKDKYVNNEINKD